MVIWAVLKDTDNYQFCPFTYEDLYDALCITRPYLMLPIRFLTELWLQLQGIAPTLHVSKCWKWFLHFLTFLSLLLLISQQRYLKFHYLFFFLITHVSPFSLPLIFPPFFSTTPSINPSYFFSVFNDAHPLCLFLGYISCPFILFLSVCHSSHSTLVFPLCNHPSIHLLSSIHLVTLPFKPPPPSLPF